MYRTETTTHANRELTYLLDQHNNAVAIFVRRGRHADDARHVADMLNAECLDVVAAGVEPEMAGRTAYA